MLAPSFSAGDRHGGPAGPAAPRGRPRGRRGRLQQPHGARRGAHARPLAGTARGAGAAVDRGAWRPAGQADGRWPAGRVRERGPGGGLCGGDAAGRRPARERLQRQRAHLAADRHQSRRRDRRGRRHLRRRRQRRRAARGDGRAGRHLRLRARSAIRSATGSRSASRTSASSTSRTSPGRSACIRIVGAATAASGRATPAHRRRRRRRERVDKPSIAVLPFVNMSGDPEQEFFADGLTEDIITELSRFRELFVISRNAVFVHKGKPVKAQEIAREFGVDYVVEGSVRKAGDRVRVTVQLIDGETDTPSLGRALRPQARGHLRHPGRGDVGDRGDAAGPRRGGARTSASSASRPRTWRPTNACWPARSCTTARSARPTTRRMRMLERAIALDPEICPRACLEGVRARPEPGCTAGATIATGRWST